MMDNREMLYTTKLYLQKLSNGQNPLDGSELPEESFLNDLGLSRAFRFAEDILEQVIRDAEKQKPIPNSRKKRFSITEEEKNRVPVSEEPVGISVFAARVAKVLDPDVKSLPGVHMTAWLESCGLLQCVPDSLTGDTVKTATEDGCAMGICTEERVARDGRRYLKNFYNADAQRFLLDNLQNIAAYQDALRLARLAAAEKKAAALDD